MAPSWVAEGKVLRWTTIAYAQSIGEVNGCVGLSGDKWSREETGENEPLYSADLHMKSFTKTEININQPFLSFFISFSL